LFWNAYSGWKNGVSEYHVYYSVDGGNYQLAGITNQNNFLHSGVAPSKNVSYFVRAFNSNKTITSSSNRINFFTQQTIAPDFIYLRSVSVTSDESIQIRFMIDSLKTGNGFDIYRGDDGLNFNKVGFIKFNGTGSYGFNDVGLKTREHSYFYKAIAKDSCNNDRTSSSVVASILLKVNNQKENMFNKQLTWNKYSGFSGGIAGYSIYRVVNDVVPSTPSAYTSGNDNFYTDNIEELAPEGSKIEYFVNAIEGLGNPYGIEETAISNLATTYIEADVYAPSAFAPNGINKVWKPVTHFVDKSEYNLKIFNRWGNLLFETNDINEGWTGKGATNEVYVYLISYKNARGEYIQLTGNFLLL
jgi:gliding motility-associated-like protein